MKAVMVFVIIKYHYGNNSLCKVKEKNLKLSTEIKKVCKGKKAKAEMNMKLGSKGQSKEK